ncbi:MAG: outer membrane protein [Desulfovibrionaceae bacterium]
MKRSFLYGILFFCICILPVQEVNATSLSFYMGAKLGYNYPIIGGADPSLISGPSVARKFSQSSSSSAFPVGLTTGMSIPLASFVSVRTSLEYLYTTPFSTLHTLPDSIDNVHIAFNEQTTIHKLFANLYLDMYATQKLYFYVGAGIGVSFISANLIAPNGLSNTKKNSTELSWNAGGGVGYHITEKIFIDLGARYTDSGSLAKRQFANGSTPIIEMPKATYSSLDILLTVAYVF